MSEIQSLGKTKNAAVIRQLVDLDGKVVVDAGCGNLTFTRLLAEQGAKVIAIDPDSVQAQKNRDADPIPGIKFFETGAESIPCDDSSVDGVFFSYSLHHVPADLFPAVYAEVLRVLRPSGFLYVLEPIDCPLNQVMRLFHDEDAERRAAWQSLHDIAAPKFEQMSQFSYYDERQFDSWDDFADRFSNRSFNSLYTEADVHRDEVRETFLRFGGPAHKFTTPKNVMLLQGIVASSQG
ncbi:class I SAM-dependent methyltransferase [Mariniblastus fucicola]|uniref:Malonyl-[acyl-carrier protein] O-methyltransferase n=1 Tax=Mariniblastus fucicola TaxID=980251 RepID=A0A5B9P741_9BACT|nr:class I SAM-dependent methyltransferase [Mariniblastus fucicola]QEG22108.1 Malonyl-[acyl-carrier protein] O-methyltransferase [Mariniblastus fucicola]